MLYKYYYNEKCNYFGKGQRKKELPICILDTIIQTEVFLALGFIDFAKIY